MKIKLIYFFCAIFLGSAPASAELLSCKCVDGKELMPTRILPTCGDPRSCGMALALARNNFEQRCADIKETNDLCDQNQMNDLDYVRD